MTLPPSVHKAGPISLVLFAALALVGCGAAPAAYPPESSTLSTTEGSLAALDRAEGELMAALGNPAGPMATASPAAQGYAQPPPPPVDAPPAPSQPAAVSPGGAVSGDKDAEARYSSPGASDPCSSACRALTSMRRATEHLCNLSGEGDDRCQGARRRVEGATERVRASCPTCSAARN